MNKVVKDFTNASGKFCSQKLYKQLRQDRYRFFSRETMRMFGDTVSSFKVVEHKGEAYLVRPFLNQGEGRDIDAFATAWRITYDECQKLGTRSLFNDELMRQVIEVAGGRWDHTVKGYFKLEDCHE